jgi:two-component system chemotaxis response regulator CheY
MRALIVDDSRFVRGYLRGLLEGKGIECDDAADGRAGIDRLRGKQSFDLALVDWNMPVMNGLDMLKTLCAEGYGLLKVMMVATDAENDFILRALNAGADECLMKPFDDESLTEKLAMLGLVEGQVMAAGRSVDLDSDAGGRHLPLQAEIAKLTSRNMSSFAA